MADIAFLLLIFFMVIVYEPDRTEVDLPDTDIRAAADDEAALVVLAFAEGDASRVIVRFTDGASESRELPDVASIEAEAARHLAAKPMAVFKIKADRAVPARLVTRAFDALSGAGAGRILLLTEARGTQEAAP